MLSSTRIASVIVAALVASSISTAPLWAQAPIPTDPPTSTTEVLGQLQVDLRGTWLLVANGKFVGLKNEIKEGGRNTVELYTVDDKNGQLNMELLQRKLPKAIADEIDMANKAMAPWKPSDAQLAEIKRSLDKLEPEDPMRYLRHTIKLYGPDRFQDAIMRGPASGMAKDALFLIDIEHEYRPQPITDAHPGAQLVADKCFYAAHKVEPTAITGEHGRAVIAAGFVPIPVSTLGEFQLYRLRAPGEAPPAEPAPTFTQRLSEAMSSLLRGCK
jgi:hypothetical protein